MWFIRLVCAPFQAIGAVVIVLIIFALGWAFVLGGLSLLPGQPIAGWLAFLFGLGIWFAMIFRGLAAMFGSRTSSHGRRHRHGR